MIQTAIRLSGPAVGLVARKVDAAPAAAHHGLLRPARRAGIWRCLEMAAQLPPQMAGGNCQNDQHQQILHVNPSRRPEQGGAPGRQPAAPRRVRLRAAPAASAIQRWLFPPGWQCPARARSTARKHLPARGLPVPWLLRPSSHPFSETRRPKCVRRQPYPPSVAGARHGACAHASLSNNNESI